MIQKQQGEGWQGSQRGGKSKQGRWWGLIPGLTVGKYRPYQRWGWWQGYDDDDDDDGDGDDGDGDGDGGGGGGDDTDEDKNSNDDIVC